MSLRTTAETDLGIILEDDVYGFGWPITITNPNGDTDDFTGFSNDISQLIDPETGQAVSGRMASVALRVSSLINAGFEMPKGIEDATSKPWIIQFNDINGAAHKFKVSQADPDRTIGMIICMLEIYK